MASLFAYLALVAGLMPAQYHLELLGAPLVLVSILTGWRNLKRISHVILTAVLFAGVAALLWAPQTLLLAAANTARLTTLVIAVMLLSATLGVSRDLGTLSNSLLSGRPLPRYLGVTFATGFLAIPLNFGAVGVMSSMVGRAIALHGDSALTRNAARAVLRGFAFSSMCSPLSVAIVLTLTFLPGLRGWQLMSAGLPLAFGYLLLGAAFRDTEDQPEHNVKAASETSSSDQTTAPNETNKTGTKQNPTLPWLPWLRFALSIGAICVGVFALSGWSKVPYASAVAISCTTAVVLGLLLRRIRGESTALPSLAHSGNELTIMSGSAFLGVLAGSAGLHLLGLGFTLPAWSYPILAFFVPYLFFLGGMVGLNAIVSGTLAGTMLGPIWPPAALLGLGLGMICGWGMTAAGTPYSANSLLLSRLTGYDARVASMIWNLKLSLCALGAAGMLSAAITYALAPGAG
jgi:hypothetical protein